MKRLPIALFLTLVLVWLLLNNTLSLGQTVAGAVLAALLLHQFARLRPVRPRLRRLHLIVPLTVTVLIDILRSNWDVGRIALGLVRNREVRTGFIDIPLELRDAHGLAVLAIILTSTPGTVWAGLSEDGRTLKLHVLDIKDEAHWIRTIKQHYEQPLLRIFE